MNSAKSAKYPDFLGIGAARAGTTWLSKVLVSHPDVWIPRIKELHYFTRSSKYLGPSQLRDANFVRRLFSQDEAYKKYREKLFKAMASNVAKPSISKLKWDCQYLLRKPSDSWYASLFNQGRGRMTGEITPRYSVLDDNDVASLKALMPKVKIIYIMRDPVERAWSLLRYHEQRGRNQLSQATDAEIEKLVSHPAIQAQSEYDVILKRWRSVFPTEQFLELYYDDIATRPGEMMHRVCDFLGLDAKRYHQSAAMLNAKVNASAEKPMPDNLRRFLVARYKPMVERLAEAEGGYFSEWSNRYEGALSEVAFSS